MGWMFYSTPPLDERQEVLRLLTWPEDLAYTAEVLRLQKVGNIWFAAVKFTGDLSPGLLSRYLPEGNTITWCALFLTLHLHGNLRGYKDITEEMGPAPCHCRCPPAILRLLSPTTNPYTLEFRERSRVWNNRPKPKIGDTIRTRKPLEFSNGTFDTFTKVKYQKRKMVFRTPTGALVRLRSEDILGSEIVT